MGIWEGFADLVRFLVARKKFWLIPIVLLLILVGGLLLLAESSPVGALLYPLF